jgi:NAD-dependent SIR2 family protein deacetylase
MTHLDGNAAAGVLQDVFGTDLTTAVATCVHCGAAAPLAMARAYMRGPGTVLRCPHCDQMLMAIAWTGRYSVDAYGITQLD